MIKLFEQFKDLGNLCEEHCIENYTLNSDGSIDVDGDVIIQESTLTKLPLRFRKVSGNFICADNQLISLDGCPKEVGGFFICSGNNLTSLKGAPIEVNGFFDCSNNKLTTLKGAPKEVGDFDCSNNKLTTLKGAPKEVSGIFDCSYNPLPDLIRKNNKYIIDILKFQDDYSIWNIDGSLNEYRFKDMMIEIKGL